MSVSAQDGDTGTVETGSATVQDLYREKPASTVVRVLTVLAYLLSVSLAAILLSIYYICVWKSPVLSKLSDNHDILSARRGDPSVYDSDFMRGSPQSFSGGSDTPVNETVTPPILDSVDDFINANESTDSIIEFVENSTLTSSEQSSTPIYELNVTTVT